VSVARFVADQRTMHQVPHVFCCRILGLSVSWFYKWLGREPTDRQVRRGELDAAVKLAFDASGGTYGSPRIHADLLEDGWAVSVNTVADSMRRQGLQGAKTQAPEGTDEAGRDGGEIPGPASPRFHRPGTEHQVVWGHHRNPHRRGQVLPRDAGPVLAQAAGLPHQHAPRRRTRVRRDQDRNHDARRPHQRRRRRISHRSRINLHRNTFHGPM
jgi:hypothetical protein